MRGQSGDQLAQIHKETLIDAKSSTQRRGSDGQQLVPHIFVRVSE